VLSIGGIASLVSQIPGGELLDAVRTKRLLIAIGVITVASGALIMRLWPSFVPVAVAQEKFKAYPIGYFHIDIAELHTAEGRGSASMSLSIAPASSLSCNWLAGDGASRAHKIANCDSDLINEPLRYAFADSSLTFPNVRNVPIVKISSHWWRHPQR
jgi:hypothetical protein